MLDSLEHSVLRARLRRVIDTHYAGRISTFGRACGIGNNVARHLLLGTHVPQAKTLQRVADGLGVTVAELVDPKHEPSFAPRRIRMKSTFTTPPRAPRHTIEIDPLAPRPTVQELRAKGLSLSQIAEIVGMSVPGVSRALSRNSKRQPRALIFQSLDADAQSRVNKLFALAATIYGSARIAQRVLNVTVHAFRGQPTDGDLVSLANVLGINVRLLATTTFEEVVFPFHPTASQRSLLPFEVENVRGLLRRLISHVGGQRLAEMIDAAPEHLFNIVGVTQRRPGVSIARRLADVLKVPEYDVRTKYIPDEVIHRLPARGAARQPVDEDTAIRVRHDLKSICISIGSVREAATVLGLPYDGLLKVVQGEAPHAHVAAVVDAYKQRSNA